MQLEENKRVNSDVKQKIKEEISGILMKIIDNSVSVYSLPKGRE